MRGTAAEPYGLAGSDQVNNSDPFGLCPPCNGQLIAIGMVLGGAVGAVVAAGETAGTAGIGVLAAPGIVVASAGLGASIGGFVESVLDGLAGGRAVDVSPPVALPLVKGDKSAEEYDTHIEKRDAARRDLEIARKDLDKASGPKSRRPIQKRIDEMRKDISRHDKEIRQKWPNGRPASK